MGRSSDRIGLGTAFLKYAAELSCLRKMTRPIRGTARKLRAADSDLVHEDGKSGLHYESAFAPSSDGTSSVNAPVESADGMALVVQPNPIRQERLASKEMRARSSSKNRYLPGTGVLRAGIS
jgi:hypothetical protein